MYFLGRPGILLAATFATMADCLIASSISARFPTVGSRRRSLTVFTKVFLPTRGSFLCVCERPASGGNYVCLFSLPLGIGLVESFIYFCLYMKIESCRGCYTPHVTRGVTTRLCTPPANGWSVTGLDANRKVSPRPGGEQNGIKSRREARITQPMIGAERSPEAMREKA